MEKLNNLTREEMIDLLMDNDFEDIRNERFLEDSWVSDILLQGFEGYGHMTDEELKGELLERELVLNSFTFNDIYDELSKDLKDDMKEVGFTDNGIKEIINYFVDVQDDEALQELNASELVMTMYYDVMAGNFDSWLSDINEKSFIEVNELLGHNNFEDFEKEFDDDIFYADGLWQSILMAIEDEEDNFFNLRDNLELYLFDGWFITLWK